MGSLYITRLISLDYVRTREELTSITDAMFTMLKTGQLNLLVNRSGECWKTADAQNHVDPVQLQEAFVNLTLNAIEAML